LIRLPGQVVGLGLALWAAGAPTLCRGTEAQWRVVKGKHFIVHHQDGAFAASVLHKAEENYRRIAKDLGFVKYDDFWLWDKRVRIYIHGSRDEFTRATGAPKWAAGRAAYAERSISSYQDSWDFLNSVLPHELTHLIFRDFVGFEGEVPLWLDEGVAQWAERGQRKSRMQLAVKLLRRGRLLRLHDLTRMDIRSVEGGGRAVDFYAQAMSVVGYLMVEHGADRFRRFCGQLRDGKSLDAALRFTYQDSVRSIGDLEQAWLKFLEVSG